MPIAADFEHNLPTGMSVLPRSHSTWLHLSPGCRFARHADRPAGQVTSRGCILSFSYADSHQDAHHNHLPQKHLRVFVRALSKRHSGQKAIGGVGAQRRGM